MVEKEYNTKTILKNFLAGGVAGMLSKTSVAPLDRLKILFQAHHYQHVAHGVLAGIKHIMKHEGFSALYKGNSAQMVRIFPHAALQYTTFELYKKNLKTVFGANSPIGTFFAGTGAGVTAVAFTYPLDTIRARLAFQIIGEHHYSGILDAARSILKNEGGLRALYRGFIPTIICTIPNSGFSFCCFEYLKYACIKYMPTYTCTNYSTNTTSQVLTIPAKFICGGIAGAVGQTIFYPIDVTRRRMQLAMMNPETVRFGKSMLQTIALIVKENGIVKGLYRGLSINYIRVCPMFAVSFTTYEVAKQFLNIDTGL